MVIKLGLPKLMDQRIRDQARAYKKDHWLKEMEYESIKNAYWKVDRRGKMSVQYLIIKVISLHKK